MHSKTTPYPTSHITQNTHHNNDVIVYIYMDMIYTHDINMQDNVTQKKENETQQNNAT